MQLELTKLEKHSAVDHVTYLSKYVGNRGPEGSTNQAYSCCF